jgi:BNR repeat-like domain
MRPRRQVRVLLTVTAAILLALGTSLPASAASLTRISTDPYTNPDSVHKTEVEPDTFAFGDTIVSTFQVGRFFNGGATNIGFATSTDAGKHWRHGFLPGITVAEGGPYDRASDPVAAYDAKHHVWLISSLGINTTGSPPAPSTVDVLVNRSTDGGRTWSGPVVVAAQDHFFDKNWTACDNSRRSPFYGNCYTEFDDNTLGDLILMSTSSDGGASWGAPKTTADGAFGIGGQPVVQRDGRVVVPINGFTDTGFSVLSFVSTDGGASWSSTVLVSDAPYHRPNGNVRATIPLPSVETDRSGKVYVAWPDCRFRTGCTANDMVLTTSTDGLAWSAVRRVPIDPVSSSVDHFVAGLGVDPASAGGSARLGLAYYFYPDAACTTATCQLDVGFLSSANGGATWTRATQLAGPMNLTWLPLTTQGYMFGDYISTSIVAGAKDATTVIEIARRPTGSTFHVDTFAASVRLGHGDDAGEVAGSAAAAGARSRVAAPPRSM